MRKFIRELLRGFFLVALLVMWTLFISLQMMGGGYAYQMQDGRLKWCIVVCVPRQEPFYDHYTNTIEHEFKLTHRLRISPWFDAGQPDITLDNP